MRKNIDIVKVFSRKGYASNARLLAAHNDIKNRHELLDYDTVIAYIEDGSDITHLNTQYYSSSTTTIQNMVRQQGGKIVEYDNNASFYKRPYRHEVAYTRA